MKYLLLLLTLNAYAELPEGKDINVDITKITKSWNKEQKAYYNYNYIKKVDFIKVDEEELLATAIAYCTKTHIYLLNTVNLKDILIGCSNVDFRIKEGGFVD